MFSTKRPHDEDLTHLHIHMHMQMYMYSHTHLVLNEGIPIIPTTVHIGIQTYCAEQTDILYRDVTHVSLET